MYEKMYYILFNAITDALRELEANNYGTAQELLKAAQLAAEEQFMENA